MIKYANTKKEANCIAKQMKKEDSEYANDVQICETLDELGGIFLEKNGKFVIHNETE